MQGTIAQIVALTTWGNADLSGALQLDGPKFYPANSTFVFCESVKFVDLKGNGSKREELEYASDPIAWFKRIKEDGVYSLRMSSRSSGDRKPGTDHVTDRMLVGLIGGGGRWLIEAMKQGGSDYWEARWEVGDRDRADRRIWRVTYGRVAQDVRRSSEGAIYAGDIKEELIANLSKIAEFARTHHEEGFAKAFDSGLARLSSNDPYDDLYHRDIAPQKVISESANQLLGAAQAAWVFGAMGSWNDMAFEGDAQAQYEELSEELYRLLNSAIIVAANSTASASPPTARKAWWRPWE